jgi:cytochrome c oxidase assembly protein subunit 15
VQLHHRLMAYLVLIVAVAQAGAAWRTRYLPRETRILGVVVAGAVVVQALLGIATLMTAVPFALGMLHQLMAAIVFSLAVAFAWRVRRT